MALTVGDPLTHPNIGNIHVLDGAEDTKALPILKALRVLRR